MKAEIEKVELWTYAAYCPKCHELYVAEAPRPPRLLIEGFKHPVRAGRKLVAPCPICGTILNFVGRPSREAAVEAAIRK